MTRNCHSPRRRRALAAALAAGGVALIGAPARRAVAALADGAAHDPRRDWAWLEGSWDVWHRRLRERLVGSDDWQEFAGRSAFWHTLDGVGNVDDNLLELPDGTYRGLSLRSFDPARAQWSIWWLDARNPARIEPPVTGGFDGGVGTFTGRDTHKGTPIIMRFRWRDLHTPRPWWEQAFSTDEGATWEINWTNYFTRTAAKAEPMPPLAAATRNRDFDFLHGRWTARHRRLDRALAGSRTWQEFGGTLNHWPVLGGHGAIGDNVFDAPGGAWRGMSARAFDPASRRWHSWWLDARRPARLAEPMRGAFADGVGTFTGADVHEDRPIVARVRWSHITPRSVRWEQAFSADGGATWETNWTTELTRTA